MTNKNNLTPAAAIVEQYFEDATIIIDDIFGRDYSRKNPMLVSAVLQAIVSNPVQQSAKSE